MFMELSDSIAGVFRSLIGQDQVVKRRAHVILVADVLVEGSVFSEA